MINIYRIEGDSQFGRIAITKLVNKNTFDDFKYIEFDELEQYWIQIYQLVLLLKNTNYIMFDEYSHEIPIMTTEGILEYFRELWKNLETERGN